MTDTTEKLVRTLKELPGVEAEEQQNRVLVLSTLNDKEKKEDFLVVYDNYLELKLKESIYKNSLFPLGDFLHDKLGDKEVLPTFDKWGENIYICNRYDLIQTTDKLVFTNLRGMKEEEIYQIIYDTILFLGDLYG